MQISDYSLIPEELCQAPNYHLEKNTAKELPEIETETTKSKYLDSLAAISAAQLFDEIPGIEKVKILVDSKTSFEIWTLIPNRVLIPEDIKLLKKDNKRVEAIVKKITEVFYCCLNSEILDKPLKIKSWEDTQELVHQYKYEFDFINIHYNHPQIKVETHQEELGQTGEYWAVYPPYLTIDLIKTRGLNGGYIIDDYNSLFNFRIMAWAGLPLFRNIKTGDIATMESLPK